MSEDAHTPTNPWVSPRRETIAALLANHGPHPDESEDKATIESLYALVRSARNHIAYLNSDRSQPSGILAALRRKAYERERAAEVADAERRLERYEAALRAPLARHEAQCKHWDATIWRREREIELAAAEEYATALNGNPAPWVRDTLGPQPPARRSDLEQRWFAVAEHIHHLRVRRDVRDPSMSGLTHEDGALARDIAKLRWHTKQALEQTPLERRFEPVEGEYRPGRINLPAVPRET